MTGARKLLALVVPLVVLVIWQVIGSRPGMDAIVPSPLTVLQGWQ